MPDWSVALAALIGGTRRLGAAVRRRRSLDRSRTAAGAPPDVDWLWGAPPPPRRPAPAISASGAPRRAAPRRTAAPADVRRVLHRLDGWCAAFEVRATHSVVQQRGARLTIRLATDGPASACARLGAALRMSGWRVQRGAGGLWLSRDGSAAEWDDHPADLAGGEAGTGPWAPLAQTEAGVVWHRFDAAWPVWVLTGDWRAGWESISAALAAPVGGRPVPWERWGWDPRGTGGGPTGWRMVDSLAPISTLVYTAGWRAGARRAGAPEWVAAVLDPERAQWRDVLTLLTEALRRPSGVCVALAMTAVPDPFPFSRRVLRLHYPSDAPPGSRLGRAGRPVEAWRGDGVHWRGMLPPAPPDGAGARVK